MDVCTQWKPVEQQKQTLQQPLQLGAVHVDILHQLNVVNIHIVLRTYCQLL